MKIVVSTHVAAPLPTVWRAYTTPEDIQVWNAASADWHTPSATVDLRVGGRFCFRMEARDGSFGFDFEGVYSTVEPMRRLEYDFGGRHAAVTFEETAPGGSGKAGVTVTVAFDAETTHSEAQQREGWQAILDHFARHVTARR